MKFSKSNLQKLEDILGQVGFKVRYEKGNFNSGYCLVEQNKVIVVNKFYDVEGRMLVLLDILQIMDIEDKSLDPKSYLLLKTFLKATL
ncbi:MAG: hypothetical protein WAT79_06090 [Saprospiraceae bacterium]